MSHNDTMCRRVKGATIFLALSSATLVAAQHVNVQERFATEAICGEEWALRISRGRELRAKALESAAGSFDVMWERPLCCRLGVGVMSATIKAGELVAVYQDGNDNVSLARSPVDDVQSDWMRQRDILPTYKYSRHVYSTGCPFILVVADPLSETPIVAMFDKPQPPSDRDVRYVGEPGYLLFASLYRRLSSALADSARKLTKKAERTMPTGEAADIYDFSMRAWVYVDGNAGAWTNGYAKAVDVATAKQIALGLSYVRGGMSTNDVVKIIGVPDVQRRVAGKKGDDYKGFMLRYYLRKKDPTISNLVNMADESLTMSFDRLGALRRVVLDKGTRSFSWAYLRNSPCSRASRHAATL